MDPAQADEEVKAAVVRAHQFADALRRSAEARRPPLSGPGPEVSVRNAYSGVAAADYARVAEDVSRMATEIPRILAAAEARMAGSARRISEFSTAELLDELRRRHAQD
ncbi:hypothetical protein [Mycobacteroides abscessus]|uniref:hypothetical protein n=1 Tax=Mycobacteroides abscessus TaxID=36809 RepID=UPI000927E516|nr:hypothetical protein [Mycobacteroides abscessus]SIC20187.1 Uncharacterised protein [Mycobacteroides abscessus subsp. abscessus]